MQSEMQARGWLSGHLFVLASHSSIRIAIQSRESTNLRAKISGIENYM